MRSEYNYMLKNLPIPILGFISDIDATEYQKGDIWFEFKGINLLGNFFGILYWKELDSKKAKRVNRIEKSTYIIDKRLCSAVHLSRVVDYNTFDKLINDSKFENVIVINIGGEQWQNKLNLIRQQ